MLQKKTESVRIDADLFEKIRPIAKDKGQTIMGYIKTNLEKAVNRDWEKLKRKQDERTGL